MNDDGDLHLLMVHVARTVSILEPTGAKPDGSKVRSVGSVADAIVQERDEQERGL